MSRYDCDDGGPGGDEPQTRCSSTPPAEATGPGARRQPFSALLTTLVSSLVPRQRQTSDEDAPPIASVNDMLNVTYTGSPSYLQRSVGISTFRLLWLLSDNLCRIRTLIPR